jgi:hypothetical protein
MRKAFKYLSIFAVLATALFGAGYLYLNLSVFKVVNISGKDILNISIEPVKEVWWQGELAPNESKWLFGTIEGNGSIAIAYDVSGERVAKVCGYYVEHSPGFEKVTLTESAPVIELYKEESRLVIFGVAKEAIQLPCETDFDLSRLQKR